MFNILQKQTDSVKAEDLETLQNEIEKCLVETVTRKWELEKELATLDSPSPVPSAQTQNSHSRTTTPTILTGKLRTSLRSSQLEPNPSENSSDGFKGSVFGSSTNGGGGVPSSGCTSGTNSGTEDSVGSDGSLVSSLAGSNTVLSSAQPETGSQAQQTNSTNLKRSFKDISSSSSGGAVVSSRPSKRFRQNSSNSFSSTPASAAAAAPYSKRPPHSKHRSKIVPSKFRNSTEESRPNKKQFHKNDAPDKLWPFVEQFCATPTEEQIKDLEDMIKAMENDKDYFKVPALGKKDSSNKTSETHPTKPEATSTGSKSQRKLKSSKSGEEDTGLGALTQRLVSSLIEDSDSLDATTKSTSSGGGAAQASKKKSAKIRNGKSFDINHAKNLEKRIRQELEEYDILTQQDEIPYTSEDDEVLRDLVASQHELLSIQRENKESMQRLVKRAKKHLELENEREKLRDANADVIAAYHKLIQAKQKKRNPTKREKEAAWKALKVQGEIFKKCDDLYLSSLNRNSCNNTNCY